MEEDEEERGATPSLDSHALASCVRFEEVLIGAGRGAVNALVLRANAEAKELVTVWLGFQNGDVVRLSLNVATMSLVGGADCVIHTHSMDVRSLCLFKDTYVVSVSDDGTLVVNGIVATSSATAKSISVSPSSELRCCSVLEDGSAVVCASRDRRLFSVDVEKCKVVREQRVADVLCSLVGASVCVTQNGACYIGSTEVAKPFARGSGGACAASKAFFAFARGDGLILVQRQ